MAGRADREAGVTAAIAVGPDAVLRPTVVADTWLTAALAELDALARSRPDPVTHDEVVAILCPWEARCRRCDVRPIRADETESDYTDYLRGEGAAHGPDSLRACQAWIARHLTWKHNLDGIAGSYEVPSGAEQWRS
jgi:hypothetical protein